MAKEIIELSMKPFDKLEIVTPVWWKQKNLIF